MFSVGHVCSNLVCLGERPVRTCTCFFVLCSKCKAGTKPTTPLNVAAALYISLGMIFQVSANCAKGSLGTHGSYLRYSFDCTSREVVSSNLRGIAMAKTFSRIA